MDDESEDEPHRWADNFLNLVTAVLLVWATFFVDITGGGQLYEVLPDFYNHVQQSAVRRILWAEASSGFSRIPATPQAQKPSQKTTRETGPKRRAQGRSPLHIKQSHPKNLLTRRKKASVPEKPRYGVKTRRELMARDAGPLFNSRDLR